MRIVLRMKKLLLAAIVLAPTLSAAEESNADKARLTVGVPMYVYHSDERSGGRQWNDGWLNNEGILVDATWPYMKLGSDSTLRLGVTGGGFDNSEFKTSLFLGGVAEVETYATEKLSFSVGSYVGAITGYEDGLTGAIAPYVGTTYAVSDRVELGARGYWLPGHTFGVADSDAYIAAATIGTRF